MSETSTPTHDPRHHYHDLRVRRVIRETADASSIVFDVPASLEGVFAYRAGQFLTLHVEVDGHQLYRCYSLASSPATDTEHKVTVKRVAGGRVSNWVNDNVREGDTVKVLPPAGHFVVEEGEDDLVLFAGGSGITPVISILKTALASPRGRVRLLYANRDEASIIFRAELDALASTNPGRLEIVHRLDARDGFVDEAAVREAAKGREGAAFYICGPGPFMDTVERGLVALDVAPSRIHIERFTSSSVDEAGDASAASGATRRVDLVLDGANHVLEVREGETVLHAARRSGLEPPFSCESGFCGCCMAKLARGRVRMIQNDFLSAAEVEEGWVLTCQAVPETDDVAVEFPD